MSAREITVLRVYYLKDGCHDYDMRRLNFMPAPDRLALARALVADMPGVVCGKVPDADEAEQSSDHETAIWGQGYNAAYTAMIAEGEKT